MVHKHWFITASVVLSYYCVIVLLSYRIIVLGKYFIKVFKIQIQILDEKSSLITNTNT